MNWLANAGTITGRVTKTEAEPGGQTRQKGKGNTMKTTFEIRANSVIDSLMPYMDDTQEFYQNVPRGSYISESSPYLPFVEKWRRAEQAINLANDLTGISITALYATVLTARRWYNKTGWQRCLSEDTAQRLLRCMAEQYPQTGR